MKASRHLNKAVILYNQVEDHLEIINDQLRNLLDKEGEDAFITFQSGDGPVVTWGGGYNSTISISSIDELLKMNYEEAVKWLMNRTI